MSGLAGIVRWDGGPVETAAVDRMLDRIRHRGPHGLHSVVNGSVGLGHAHTAIAAREEGWRQPLASADGARWIVADVRLYNRGELLDRLEGAGCGAEDSDARLLLLAYERWGESMLDEIDGDFAFAIWDGRKRVLFAARDPFGVRPFFFHAGHDALVLASEPKQILVTLARQPPVDDVLVGEYLFQAFRDLGRTFHEGVRRLRPGHALVARAGAVAERRWWQPDPSALLLLDDHREYAERFGALLSEAVARRLQVPGRVLAQLSGGLDSSSVVVCAAELEREGRPGLAQVETVSALYPGTECDESRWIETVTRAVPFRAHSYDPLDEPVVPRLDEQFLALDSPMADLQVGAIHLETGILRARGSRVVLTGLGGDEIADVFHYGQDLARRGRFLSLVAEAWRSRHTSWGSFSEIVIDALRSLAPDAVVAARRRARRNRRAGAPAWMARPFRQFLRQDHPPRPEPEVAGYPSLVQEYAYRWTHYASTVWGLEALEATAARAGFEYRHPFLDRRLVELALSIPYQHRAPAGRSKRLLRDAMGTRLPAEISAREGKTVFDPFMAQVLQRDLPLLRERLGPPGSWIGARWIDPRACDRLLAGLAGARPWTPMAVHAAWAVATLELWERGRGGLQARSTAPWDAPTR